MSLTKIIIYKTNTGKEPFTRWLLDLDKMTRSIVITRLKRVSLGNFGDSKLLKQADGVWELRIDYGSGYRIYFGKQGNTIIVLLVGGDKRTQDKDIVKAQRYWLNYKESVK
ncbi:MAG: type II toxin-antitoxin system RelE/ParE family toxin [Candidatus Babeliaceae bacterium]|jgi:putative addiction module killer protein